MTSSKSQTEREPSTPPAPIAAATSTRDQDPARGEDSTFAALLSELAQAPEIRPRQALVRGERAGEYVIVEPIGRGAFGTVYRALHPVLGSEVAIKVLNSVHAADPNMARRFIEEARVIHRIRHPNMVELLGFGELPSGVLYYVMELLAGSTLAAQLEARGALEPRLALSVLTQIAAALDAAHGHGVLHRDLKPDNVFVVGELGPDCTIKLLDFGIAKLLGDDAESRTRSGMLIGTPGYMAPEQCSGETLDVKADIYALGLIAHELLTGQRLFPGPSARELMAQHLFEPPPPVSSVRSGLPAQLDAPLLAMLAKQPAQRPASATAAIAALSNVLTGSEHGPMRGKARLPRARIALIAAAFIAALWYVQRTYWAPSSARPLAPPPAAQLGDEAGPSPVPQQAPAQAPAPAEPAAAQRKPEEQRPRGRGAARGETSPGATGRPAARRARGELEF